MLGFNFLLELKCLNGLQRFFCHRATRGCGCGLCNLGEVSAVPFVTSQRFFVFSHTLYGKRNTKIVLKSYCIFYRSICVFSITHLNNVPQVPQLQVDTPPCVAVPSAVLMPCITNSRYCPGYDYI